MANGTTTYTYFGGLMLLIAFASPVGALIDVQTAYMLKNALHASASDVSLFRLVTGVPLYLGFLFGLLRDQWNPFGLRDRGYFLLFGSVLAFVYLYLAAVPVTYAGLALGSVLAMLASRCIAAAYQGLIALVGQEKLMSGRLSALWNIVAYIPGVLGALASGYVSDHLRPAETFLIVGTFAVAISVMALWTPTSVYGGTYTAPQASSTSFVESVRRLFRHRAIYPAVAMMLVWSFSPGVGTAMMFHLSNDLHAPDSTFSYYSAIFAGFFIPTFLLYGFLCSRWNLRRLLWLSVIVAIPQLLPLAFIEHAEQALWLAAPVGLMGGLLTAALFDLAMRSCPPGLQGALMMMVDAGMYLSSRAADLLGSMIYAGSPTHGFLYCVALTTAVYVFLLPMIRLIPKELIATADGEPNPDVDAALRKEIAGSAT